MNFTPALFAAIADELTSIVASRGKVSADYAREFAVYSTGFATSLLDSPDPNGLERFKAQARAVVETIKEINEQAIPDVLDAVLDAIRLILVVVRAATIKL